MKTDARLTLTGVNFSPSAAQRETGATFSEFREPGAIGDRGKFKGLPVPFGWASVEIATPEGDWTFDLVEQSIMGLIAAIPTFRLLGVEDATIHLSVGYREQCNLAFPATLLHKLGEAGIDLTVTCYSLL